jgi:hypothetical protein
MELTRESLDEILTFCPDVHSLCKRIAGDEMYNHGSWSEPILWYLARICKARVDTWATFPRFNPNQCDSYGNTLMAHKGIGFTTYAIEYFVDLGWNLNIETGIEFHDVMYHRSREHIQILIDCGLFYAYQPPDIEPFDGAHFRRTRVRTICATFLLSNLLVKDLVKMVVAIIWRSARYPEKWN